MINWNEYIQTKYLDGYVNPDNYNSVDILEKLKAKEYNDKTKGNCLYLNNIKLKSGILNSKNINIGFPVDQDKITIEFKKDNNNFINNFINDLKIHYETDIFTSFKKNNNIKNLRIKNMNINRITYLIKYNNGIYDEYIKFNPIYENLKSQFDVAAILKDNDFELLFTPIIYKPKDNIQNNIQNNIQVDKNSFDEMDINEEYEYEAGEKKNVFSYANNDNSDDKMILILKVNTIIINFGKNLIKYPYIKKIFEKINANNKIKEKEFFDKIKKEEKVIIDTKFSKYKKNKINIKNSNEKIINLLVNN
jgi:hypothetical protein